MRFIIDTFKLKEGLDVVNFATASSSTTPILENILIKANYKSLVLTSNNLEMAIEHSIEEWVEIEVEWSYCIPSKIFTSYISLLNEDRVSIELNSSSEIVVKTLSSEIKIKWTPAWEFPLIPSIKEVNNFEIESKTFKTSIEKTLFSAAEWNIRPNLAWIFMSISEWNLTMASTDSFRLTQYKTPLISKEGTFGQILPWKTASVLSKLINSQENIIITSEETQIVFSFWNTKVFSRLLNWKFPDYKGFFPKTYNTKVVADKYDLMTSLRKISLFSRETNYSIRMNLSAEMWIEIETSQTQIWEWRVSMNWAVEWEDAVIWINSEYLLEALWVIEPSHISISFESPLAPIMIQWIYDEEEEKNKKGDFNHIIMPLKI